MAITRLPNFDSRLRSLFVNKGCVLSPLFDPETFAYSCSVHNSVDVVTPQAEPRFPAHTTISIPTGNGVNEQLFDLTSWLVVFLNTLNTKCNHRTDF